MAFFTIRVLMSGATQGDYGNLGLRLSAVGVRDAIQDDAGGWYRLPPAEYNYEGTATADQVLATVSAVAQTVGRPFQVFVTQASKRVWRGLPSIQPRATPSTLAFGFR